MVEVGIYRGAEENEEGGDEWSGKEDGEDKRVDCWLNQKEDESQYQNFM